VNTEILGKRNTQLPVPTSIDMSKVYSLVRAAHDTHELPLAEPDLLLSTENPLPEIMLSLPFDQPIALRLTKLEERRAHMLKLDPMPESPGSLSLGPLNADSYQVQIGGMHGGDSQLRLEIPRSLDRFINAATLKAMVVGANHDDVLFRKAGERWDICDDVDRIDLEDRTAIFKLGRIEIQS
jgi:hypothetical protein